MNKYLLLLVVMLGVSLFFTGKYAINKKADYVRVNNNYQESVEKNKQIVATYEELNKVQKKKISDLADSLKVKPKFIKEVILVNVGDTIRDTIPVEVVKVKPFVYTFSKDTACFSIDGIINNEDKAPKLSFTKLQYNNEISGVLYIQRKQWKMWFIKSRFLGQKEAKLETFSECGTSTIEDIKIIKK